MFDRATGEPIWPIEERPVPQGDAPGEWYAATQPFPTKPPAYDQQGVPLGDLIDFTPELRAEAEAILDGFVWGPYLTPPTLVDESPGGTKGTLSVPGIVGGTDWNGAGVDPETGIIYVPSNHSWYQSRTGPIRAPAVGRGPGAQGAAGRHGPARASALQAALGTTGGD